MASASCITSKFGSDSSPQIKLTVVEDGSTETVAKLKWTLQFIVGYPPSTSVKKNYKAVINGITVAEGSYDINGKNGTYTIASSGSKPLEVNKTTSAKSVSFSCSMDFNINWSGTWGYTKSASGSISIPAKTSYTINYNANGGSNAPGKQTKWHGTAITLSSTKPTRTGHTFKGWATSSSGSVAYAAGASYSANATVTLYAVWEAYTYKVTYNANGGSKAPSAQTKTYGKSLTLSSTKPTRENYNFLGWGTSASTKTVTYESGARYTNNANITLYAVWELAYVKPTITNLSIDRCTSNGILNDSENNALVKFDFSTFQDPTSILIEWKAESDTEWSSREVLGHVGYGRLVLEPYIDDYGMEQYYYDEVTLPHTDINKGSVTIDHVTVVDPNDPANMFQAVVSADTSGNFLSGSIIVGTIDYSTSKINIINGYIPAGSVITYKYTPSESTTVTRKGNIDEVIGDDLLNTDSTYDFRVTVTDSDSFTITRALSGSVFSIDCLPRDKGIAFGKPAELEGYFDVNYKAKFRKNLEIDGLDPDGNAKTALFQSQNENGNTVVGFGNYDSKSGNTNIYGYDTFIGVSNIADPGTYRPYRRRGDSITVSLRTSGYVTNGGKDVSFMVPLGLPIIGKPTVTAASVNGFVLRQGTKYTHGSTGDSYVSPDSYSAGSVNPSSIAVYTGIYITAHFSDVTNVTNNDSIGIYWNGTITFS